MLGLAKMIPNLNTRESFEKKFATSLKSGWFRKPRYRRLSKIFPRWTMETKIRKTYHRRVAEIAEGRFLDIGCGLGSCAALRGYMQGGFNVGIDFAFPAVRYALNEARRMGISAEYMAGDGFRLPFHESVFDSVYIGQVVEHIRHVEQFLIETVRVLREGGLMIISVPKGKSCGGEEAGHVNFYYTEDDCLKIPGELPVKHETFYPFHRHRFFFSFRRVGA